MEAIELDAEELRDQLADTVWILIGTTEWYRARIRSLVEEIEHAREEAEASHFGEVITP